MVLFKCCKRKVPRKFSHEETTLGGIHESLAQQIFLRDLHGFSLSSLISAIHV